MNAHRTRATQRGMMLRILAGVTVWLVIAATLTAAWLATLHYVLNVGSASVATVGALILAAFAACVAYAMTSEWSD